MDLTDLDAELLNAVQWSFPLDATPYATLAERLGTTEDRVLADLRAAKDAGVLRQLSAIFDTRALGYSSALVAAKVDPDHIDAAAARINEHPGVSHNYKRNHEYNLWYTLAVPPGEDFDAHLDVLHRASGASVTRKLPTLKLYKIGVKLDMTGKTAANAKAEVLEHERPERRPDMVAPDAPPARGRRDPDRADGPSRWCPDRSRRRPRRSAPPRRSSWRFSTSFAERKLMRRFAAVMNHRTAGFKANAMGVWAVPEDQLPEIGPQMAGFAAVSHCYRRPTYEDWPYTVFTMVHGRIGSRLRGDDRGDRDRDRRRRVRAALVDQGVQEGAPQLLHPGVGRVERRAPRRGRTRPLDSASAPTPATEHETPGDADRGRARSPGDHDRVTVRRRRPARRGSRAASPRSSEPHANRVASSRSVATTHGCTR